MILISSLCGAIGYNARHYIAYCRRLSGIWRFYNDLLSSSEAIGDHSLIEPHGVFYLIENSVDD